MLLLVVSANAVEVVSPRPVTLAVTGNATPVARMEGMARTFR